MVENTDKKFDSHPEKIERTGVATLNIKHDDGSVFEMKGDPRIIDKLVRQNTPPATKTIYRGVRFNKYGKIVGR